MCKICVCAMCVDACTCVFHSISFLGIACDGLRGTRCTLVRSGPYCDLHAEMYVAFHYTHYILHITHSSHHTIFTSHIIHMIHYIHIHIHILHITHSSHHTFFTSHNIHMIHYIHIHILHITHSHYSHHTLLTLLPFFTFFIPFIR